MRGTTGKILIVDDEAVVELQVNRLKRIGHDVYSVRSIEEVFEKLSTEQFDVLLLDESFPGQQSGLDVYVILKERGLSLPTILITSFNNEGLILRAMRAGIRDFLPKSMDYLDDLPMSVERVLRQISTEQQLMQSEILREKQDQLRRSFEAARLGFWDWNLRTGVVTWSGFHQELFGFRAGEVVTTFDDLLAQIAPEDRGHFNHTLETARLSGGAFDEKCRVRTAKSGERWLQIKGRFFGPFHDPSGMAAIVLDVTQAKQIELELKQSHDRAQEQNERLRASVTEAHHRVKNSLQTLSSLINLQRGEGESLSGEAVEKILSHLQGFAAVHDALTTRSNERGGLEVKDIEVIPILERVISVVSRLRDERKVITEFDSCRDCRVSDRHASSLAIIVNELFSNAIRYGSGRIWITAERLPENRAQLIFENEGSQFPDDFSPDKGSRTGLFLLNVLCQSDYGSEAKFGNSPEGHAQVIINFPLFAGHLSEVLNG